MDSGFDYRVREEVQYKSWVNALARIEQKISPKDCCAGSHGRDLLKENI